MDNAHNAAVDILAHAMEQLDSQPGRNAYCRTLFNAIEYLETGNISEARGAAFQIIWRKTVEDK